MRSFGRSFFTCLMSSMPLLPGIDISSRSTSKSSSRTRCITSWPSRASLTTSNSLDAWSNWRNPSRTIV
jgi:hypothetical protein